MNVTYKESGEIDAARIIGTYTEVKRGFFQHHQFLILPYPKQNGVYLPDLNFSKLSEKNLRSSYHSADYSEQSLKQITSQLTDFTTPKKISTSLMQKSFEQVLVDISSKILLVFPTIYPLIDDVIILITPFGTTGSFDFKKTKGRYTLYLWIRNTGTNIDQIISQLLHCLISSYVLIDTKIGDTLSHDWKKREAIVDFLMTNIFTTKKSKYLAITLKALESKQKPFQLVQDSNRYLRKINLIIQPPIIKKTNNFFSIDDKDLKLLTDKESRLFEFLFLHKNRYVSKNDIIEKVYIQFEVTDWSISKLIERLRKKIIDIGIEYPLIKTSRKMGYCLNCM